MVYLLAIGAAISVAILAARTVRSERVGLTHIRDRVNFRFS
jgi:hypothetical protein